MSSSSLVNNHTKDIPLKELKNESIITKSLDSESVNSGQFENLVNTSQVQTPSFFVRWFQSFLPKEVNIKCDDEIEEQYEKAKISPLYTKFIALGGGLGTGLMVGTGMALSTAGPGGLTITNFITCLLIFLTVMGGGELAISYPTLVGGFNAYPSLLVDPSLAFALAWGYCINWQLVLPLEMVTASMTIMYWNDTISPAIFVTVFLLLIYSINFIFGARGYSVIEFTCCCFKLVMFVSFIIISIISLSGGFSPVERIGLTLYNNPGAFANGFKGVCACFITSAFSLGGTEAMILTAADQKNPRRAIPKALKFVVYRCVLFYLLAVFLLGLMIAYNSPGLMGSGHSNSAPVSPFVLAVVNCGVKGFNHIYNTIILAAIVSVGNAAFYASSRTLHSLSIQGYNLKCFTYTDRENRPLVAMAATAVVGLFSYIACYKDQEKIFTWLMSLSGMSTIFTWMSINISHIRFNRALTVQNIDKSTLGYRATFGVAGSYIALITYSFICVVFFWTSLFPLGSEGKTSIINFFQNYMGLFTFLAFYIGHKIYRAIAGEKFIFFFIRAKDIDLVTERMINDKEVLEKEDIEAQDQHNSLSWYRKFLSWVF